MNTLSKDSKPWYREPWPWILMAGPAIVVVAGFVTAWLAVRSNDGLVEDDYYKQGLAVNQRQARDQAAAGRGLAAELIAGSNGLDLRLFLAANDGAALPETLLLKVVHPTRAGADQSVVLKKDAAGFYIGRLTVPLKGRWHVLLEDEGRSWRIAGDWNADGQAAASLKAAVSVSN
ncbi:FixH family protein [Azospira restricta]|uniref:FixH family protein n=1 Tax=Azospira restricta TaxID=404405 RepID=A0A974PYF2_9RHOO|nr:FixH family protein [Azospira restricta]QRJ63408.1 FixH family protein [Azospira restricta]